MYANAGAQVRWCEADVRKCRGVGTLVRIRMYANAEAQVRWCGYECTQMRGRGGGNAGAGDEWGAATGGAVGG